MNCAAFQSYQQNLFVSQMFVLLEKFSVWTENVKLVGLNYY